MTQHLRTALLNLSITSLLFAGSTSWAVDEKRDEKAEAKAAEATIGESATKSETPKKAAKAKSEKKAAKSAKRIKKGGIEYEIVKAGKKKGKTAKAGNPVSVHYDGRLEDGTPFDSSRKHGEPFTFLLGGKQVIAGWDIGVEGMKEGEKRTLYIPSEFAYGDRGVPGAIPAKAKLIFDVELLEVKSN